MILIILVLIFHGKFINNNNYKFRVEIKKENDDFVLIHEGYNLYCTIDNLKINTNYKIRICPIIYSLLGYMVLNKKNKNF